MKYKYYYNKPDKRLYQLGTDKGRFIYVENEEIAKRIIDLLEGKVNDGSVL